MGEVFPDGTKITSTGNVIEGFKEHLAVGPNDQTIGKYFTDKDNFNEFWFKYDNIYVGHVNYGGGPHAKYRLDDSHGSVYHRCNNHESRMQELDYRVNISNLYTRFRFCAKKTDLNNPDLLLPSALLPNYFNCSQMTTGAPGILKTYWNYPSIIAYSINAFNACFILKTKQKYAAYFFTEKPFPVFERIGIKDAFDIIKKMDMRAVKSKEMSEKYQEDIIAGMI